jgi:hypothetical protein
MNLLVEAIGGVLLRAIWWVALFPVVWLVATPIILVAAMFTPLPYWPGIKALYGCVTDIWSRWGLELFSWI